MPIIYHNVQEWIDKILYFKRNRKKYEAGAPRFTLDDDVSVEVCKSGPDWCAGPDTNKAYAGVQEVLRLSISVDSELILFSGHTGVSWLMAYINNSLASTNSKT